MPANMGVGYTTLLYDSSDVEDGLWDIAACRYDGVEIGLDKLLKVGPKTVRSSLSEHDLDLYCVVGGWIESDETVARIRDNIDLIDSLGADFVGVLPPRRGLVGDDTLQSWLDAVGESIATTDLTGLIHHHGATHIESPDEIGDWLDRTSSSFDLLFDTAHWYPYQESYPSDDVTEGIRRFGEDISYIHLKDIDPSADFTDHRDRLSSGDLSLDSVVEYFRTFTDLGDGLIDFTSIPSVLEEMGYDGHLTIEIENRSARPLVHAKRNYEYYAERIR